MRNIKHPQGEEDGVSFIGNFTHWNSSYSFHSLKKFKILETDCLPQLAS
jgi:hypothetical protein